MARKKRPNIQGHNPNYSTNFTSPRENTSTFTAKTSSPTPKNQTVETKTQKPTEKPAPLTEKLSKPTEKPAPKLKTEKKRETRLGAGVKVEQGAKLDALAEQGISPRNAIILAGRRATARFELKAKFVEKPEAERLPMREGYHTTKRLPASILDDLREKHDPLKLQSDSAMVRGQFEPLFWTCLDEVIQELLQKKN